MSAVFTVFLVKCAGGFLHTLFLVADFGFYDFHFVGVVKPAFEMVAAVSCACLISVHSPDMVVNPAAMFLRKSSGELSSS